MRSSFFGLVFVIFGGCGTTEMTPAAVVCPRSALDTGNPALCIWTTLDCPDGNRYAAGCQTSGAGGCTCARNGNSVMKTFTSTTWCTDSDDVRIKALREQCGFPL
ncbi:MAG: hypothetical protein Q8L14_31945 [Myxococcales bacterium]|nr:hypothetical protein [Myxococcales bacterium]